MKKVSLFIVYLISFIYMEILYKIFIYDNIFRLSIINMLLFLIPFSLIIYLISKLFKEKINKIIYIIIMSIIGIWFSAEYVVKGYFDFYISLSTFQVADQVGDFFGKAVIETLKRLPGIILLFMPLIIGIIFNKKINFNKNSYKKSILIIVVIILTF